MAEPFRGLHSCIECAQPLVFAATVDNWPMTLDPTPTDDGELYVVGDLLDYPTALYGDDRTPRYNRHQCELSGS